MIKSEATRAIDKKRANKEVFLSVVQLICLGPSASQESPHTAAEHEAKVLLLAMPSLEACVYFLKSHLMECLIKGCE